MSLDIPAEVDTDQLKKLREPFPAEQIGKLPKGGMFLDFVGHGWLTQRFLDVDPLWNWEPFSTDENGLPRLDGQGGLWIRLTICGVTRIGYGEGKGPDGVKIAIGDALRNAGMRFGAALDLWCKGDPDASHQRADEPVDRDFEKARDELAAEAKARGFTREGMEDKCIEAVGLPITASKIRGFIKTLEPVKTTA